MTLPFWAWLVLALIGGLIAYVVADLVLDMAKSITIKIKKKRR